MAEFKFMESDQTGHKQLLIMFSAQDIIDLYDMVHGFPGIQDSGNAPEHILRYRILDKFLHEQHNKAFPS